MAQTVLIVGGGTMGRGIAGVCALAGFDTTIAETDRAARERLVASIEASWKRAVEAGKLDAAKAHSAAGRLSTVSGPADAPEAAIAIEAVPESLELKERIFRELDRLLPKARFLATNTSSLSIAAIARSTGISRNGASTRAARSVAAAPAKSSARVMTE